MKKYRVREFSPLWYAGVVGLGVMVIAGFIAFSSILYSLS